MSGQGGIKVEAASQDRHLAHFNPFGPDFRTDPFAFHGRLVAASPGFMDMEGVPSAYVAAYGQVTSVLRNFKAFSSLKPENLPGMERIDFFNGLPVMNYSDPPDHTRRRKVVNPAFTPKRTELLNGAAATQIDGLLEDAVGKGTFEVVSGLTRPLSLETLMTRFLGIDKKDQPIFLNYVKTLPLLDKLKPGDPKPEPFLEAWAEGAAFCRRQQALAREGRCDNLIGVIANSSDGGAIDENEMMAMMIVLLTGGFSTVAGAATSALLYLARNPDIAARIRNDPSLSAQHLEETLRMDPPVSLVMRFAAAGAEVAGQEIPAGMPVYVLLNSANKDPSVFHDPYRFDLDRPNSKDHLAFGQGMHTCIGNAITRNLVPLLVRKVVERFETIEVADVEDAVRYDTSTPRARHLGRLMLTVA